MNIWTRYRGSAPCVGAELDVEKIPDGYIVRDITGDEPVTLSGPHRSVEEAEGEMWRLRSQLGSDRDWDE